jgi:murein DD-endopeptidase MepM/ murein hydrolase activator NlpD
MRNSRTPSWFVALATTVLWFASPAEQAFARNKRPKAVKARKSTVKSKNSKKRAAPPIPVRPPADIPLVTEPASVWQGCLERSDVPELASRLKMDESRFESLLRTEGVVNAESTGCRPYVAATGGENGVASVAFERDEADSGKNSVVAIRKTWDGVIATPGACECTGVPSRAVVLSAREASDPASASAATLPESVRWQLSVLVPQMVQRIFAKQTSKDGNPSLSGDSPSQSEDAPNTAENPTDAQLGDYAVRVIVESHGDVEPEHLQSLDLIEVATDKNVDSVWWLEREGRPGVFIGMDGLAYERSLWQSPVKYQYTSRGVGPAVTTFRRRVKAPKDAAKKGTGKDTVVRTVKIREFHLGIDMRAPKGYEVHAVSDATVSFAGRRGGYGNLIILDHGMGYETYYAHLSKIGKGVKPGAKVVAGEVIGLVGSTGRSTAPHLHFETRKDHVYLDPFDNTHQLDFWLLSADDQERLAMQLLSPESSLSNLPTAAASQPPASLGGLSASGAISFKQ